MSTTSKPVYRDSLVDTSTWLVKPGDEDTFATDDYGYLMDATSIERVLKVANGTPLDADELRAFTDLEAAFTQDLAAAKDQQMDAALLWYGPTEPMFRLRTYATVTDALIDSHEHTAVAGDELEEFSAYGLFVRDDGTWVWINFGFGYDRWGAVCRYYGVKDGTPPR